MGRLHHLMETLCPNLSVMSEFQGLECILLNYNSPDLLDEWVKNELYDHINEGRMTYYKTSEPTTFHIAHAKNVAHRLATGNIVCNLDADTFLSVEFVNFVRDAFADGLHRTCVAQTESCDLSGRIAISRLNFLNLGGYNEKLVHGWGYDDHDFLRRATLFGVSTRLFRPDIAKVIQHGNLERVRYTESKSIEESHARNVRVSEDAIARGEIVANRGRSWGVAKVVRNFDD